MSRAAGIGLVSLSLVATFVWPSGLPAASAQAVPRVDFRRDIQTSNAARSLTAFPNVQGGSPSAGSSRHAGQAAR
jgi:hypothetical protein